MAGEEKHLKIILDFLTNKQGIDQSKTGLKEVIQGQKDNKTQTEQSTKAVVTLAEKMGALQSVGLKMGATGAAITGPLIKAANDYVNAVNATTSTSRQWIGASLSIESSWQKIGGSVAQILLPALKEGAKLAQDIANFLSKNPVALKAILAAGGVLAAGGAAMVGVTQAANFAKTLATLGIGGGAAVAAGGAEAGAAVGGTAAGIGLSAILPVVIPAIVTAAAAYLAIKYGPEVTAPDNSPAAVEARKNEGWFKKIENWAAKQANAITNFVKGQPQDTYQDANGNLISPQSQGVVPTSATVSTPQGEVPPEMAAVLQKYGMAYLQYLTQEQEAQQQHQLSVSRETRDFYRQQNYAQEDYQKQVYRSTRDFNLQQTYSLQDYQKQVYRSNRDFNISQTQDQKMFLRQQSLATRDYYISVGRSQQDFQRSQSRAAQDHSFDMFQTALSGDAMSYYLAQRSYNISKTRAEEDFTLQQSRSAQDFNIQQSDATTNFQIQRDFSQKQFALQQADAAIDFQIQRDRASLQFGIQQADAAQDFQIQRTRAAEQFAITLADQAQDFQIQENQRQVAFNLQLINLQGDVAQIGYLWSTLTAYMQNDLINQLNSIGAGGSLQLLPYPTPTVSREAGGYIPGGLILSHPGEFMLNAGTVDAAERLANRSLDQSTVLALMAHGTGGGEGKTLNYSPNQVFSRGMSSEDRIAVKADMESLVNEVFR